MDFIVGFHIWVVVDRLTKVAHFIPVNTTYSGARLAELYISRTVCLHGVPKMVQAVQENLRIAQSRQKSYADGKWRDLTFKVNNYVYLKVSPMRGIRRFNIKGKLAPRYISPYRVLERKGEVAYRLELPTKPLRSSRCLPYISAEEVSASTRGAATTGWSRYAGRSDLY